jgi:glycosyltransferase involved in cell wall biosynthesis
MRDTEFSVVITCYNKADTIARAIRSAREQVLPAAEIVVVDDESTDASWAAITAESGVKALRTGTNCGPLGATLLGLRAAGGRFIVTLDGDDELQPEALSVFAAIPGLDDTVCARGNQFHKGETGTGTVASVHPVVRRTFRPARWIAFSKGTGSSSMMFPRRIVQDCPHPFPRLFVQDHILPGLYSFGASRFVMLRNQTHLVSGHRNADNVTNNAPQLLHDRLLAMREFLRVQAADEGWNSVGALMLRGQLVDSLRKYPRRLGMDPAISARALGPGFNPARLEARIEETTAAMRAAFAIRYAPGQF